MRPDVQACAVHQRSCCPAFICNCGLHNPEVVQLDTKRGNLGNNYVKLAISLQRQTNITLDAIEDPETLLIDAADSREAAV